MATAIRLMDAEGLDALSMRRIADELGTGAASLYWHVGSKDGLLDLVFDELIGEVTIPDPDPPHWREQVKQVARAQRAGIFRHPYVVRISIGRIPMGPNALRYSERTLAILRAGGLPQRLAVRGSHLLIAAVNGFTLDETGVGGIGLDSSVADATSATAADAERVAAHSAAAAAASSYLASLPPERFPNLVALAPEFGYPDRDEQFELLIDIFVDGLARLAKAG
ncbi:MAG: TetR/AcrR family transcriptional regulator C-terminal domain-containing protein [Actinobacteria bacterium]|nr:TetR/AcrR family transcriptional regulator C-terminal domain-containing protein [Actinomycetota bacterium]